LNKLICKISRHYAAVWIDRLETACLRGSAGLYQPSLLACPRADPAHWTGAAQPFSASLWSTIGGRLPRYCASAAWRCCPKIRQGL